MIQRFTLSLRTSARVGRDAAAAVCLVALTLVVYAIVHRIDEGAASVPVAYSGDALAVMAWMKGYANGEISFFGSKIVSTLGSVGASWNDYPQNDDLIYWVGGAWVAVFGLALGTHVALWTTYVLAALSFFAVARYYRADRLTAIVGAIAFAFCAFHVFRSLTHFTLANCWHLPLMLLASHMLWREAPLARGQLAFVMLVSVLTANLNIYFAAVWLGLVSTTALRAALLLRWRRLATCAAAAAAFVAMFALTNFDSFSYWAEHGRNAVAFARPPHEAVLYGMRMADWFYPPPWHAIEAVGQFSRSRYLERMPQLGEADTGYIGVVGICALVMLVAHCVIRILRREPVPTAMWLITAIFVAASVGGAGVWIASVTGTAYFRGANRFSVVIVLIAMLFCALHYRKFFGSLTGRLVLLCVLVVATLDARWLGTLDSTMAPRIQEDRALVTALSRGVAKARVFQFPNMPWPEAGRSAGMLDYELFRPFLWATNATFSYGGSRGRPEYSFAERIASLPAREIGEALSESGFTHALIHKAGLVDGGRNLSRALSAHGRLDFESNGYALYALRSSRAEAPRTGDDVLVLVKTCAVGVPTVVGECRTDDENDSYMRVDAGRMGTAWYGPYDTVPAGRYRAKFWVTSGASASTAVGHADVATGGRSLVERTLVSGGNRQLYEIDFTAAQALPQFEARVFAGGGAELKVHRVEVWRLRTPVR